MTKEELIKLSRENLRKSKQGSLCECYDEAFIKGYELSKKRIAELEEKISVLLSCKNCPENKGGFICVKEYEDKCLAQKIQYIKELKETVMKMNNVITETFSNLTRAKEHIKQLLDCLKQDTNDPQTNYYVCKYMDKAEQFLKESEVEK